MKRAISIFLLQSLVFPVLGQFICGHTQETTTQSGNQYIANGGVFTPKGELRVLVVFIMIVTFILQKCEKKFVFYN